MGSCCAAGHDTSLDVVTKAEVKKVKDANAAPPEDSSDMEETKSPSKPKTVGAEADNKSEDIMDYLEETIVTKQYELGDYVPPNPVDSSLLEKGVQSL